MPFSELCQLIRILTAPKEDGKFEEMATADDEPASRSSKLKTICALAFANQPSESRVNDWNGERSWAPRSRACP
jgi:hypothetical protein